MNLYLEKLKTELGKDDSVLEVLHRCYRELHPTDSETISRHFSRLNDILGKLTLRECDQVWDLTCALCGEHEREGFLEGVHVGMGLMTELAEK